MSDHAIPVPESAIPAPGDRFPGEGDIDAVLAEFGGDARAAIRALLADLDTLARDAEAGAATTSRGYVRGRFGTPPRRTEPI